MFEATFVSRAVVRSVRAAVSARKGGGGGAIVAIHVVEIVEPNTKVSDWLGNDGGP